MGYTKEQRAAKAAAEAAEQDQNLEQTQEQDPAEATEKVSKPLEKAPVPIPEPLQTPVGVSNQEMAAFLTGQDASNRKMAEDAIKGAIEKAQLIASQKIENSPEYKALKADMGNIAKRMAFLHAWGSSKLIPDPPEPTAYGIKDEGLMRWTALYKPDEFLKTYAHSNSPLTRELKAEIKSRQ